MHHKKILFILIGCAALLGCSQAEPPRAVEAVSSANTATLSPPKVRSRTENGIEIVYPQVSIGFDANCSAFRVMSDKLNQCAKLPANVKNMAIEHCALFDKQAMFIGNKTNFLHMTVSRFECRA